jgi:hypothetical protein
MVEPISTIKAGTAMAAPTGRVVRRVLKDRKRCKCMEGYLRAAIATALRDSRPDTKYAVPINDIGDIVERALGRAREEADGTSWRKLPQRFIGKVRRKPPDLSPRTTAGMQQVITRWILAGLPTGDYDWSDLAERSAAGFREALWAGQKDRLIEPECLAFAIELEKAFQENDALNESFSQKKETRKATIVAGISGFVISGILGTVGEVQHIPDALPAAGGVLGLSLIATIWLGVRAHQQPRWDQAAALELALDTARDWLCDVHAGNLKPTEARQLLDERVTPRLADWDVPIMDALLRRIADQIDDRASCRVSFNERRLNELFAQAAQLLSMSHELDPPSSRQSPDMSLIPIAPIPSPDASAQAYLPTPASLEAPVPQSRTRREPNA